MVAGTGGGHRCSAVVVVADVVTLEPGLEVGVCRPPALRIGLLDTGGVQGELEQEAVRVAGVEGAAVPVLQDVGLVRLPVGVLEALGESVLDFLADLERDVLEGECGIRGPNCSWSAGSANWKKARALPSPRP